MSKRFSDEFLRRLRNHVSWSRLLAKLNWPHKRREGQLAFLCPSCHEYRSAVNPKTNLGRCFHCERNFNPIDITMTIQDCDFVEAVTYLTTEFTTQANRQ
jgi:DNA primase